MTRLLSGDNVSLDALPAEKGLMHAAIGEPNQGTLIRGLGVPRPCSHADLRHCEFGTNCDIHFMTKRMQGRKEVDRIAAAARSN